MKDSKTTKKVPLCKRFSTTSLVTKFSETDSPKRRNSLESIYLTKLSSQTPLNKLSAAVKSPLKSRMLRIYRSRINMTPSVTINKKESATQLTSLEKELLRAKSQNQELQDRKLVVEALQKELFSTLQQNSELKQRLVTQFPLSPRIAVAMAALRSQLLHSLDLI